MAQQAKAFATKPDSLRLIPRIHMVQSRTYFYHLPFDSMRVPWSVCIHMHAHTGMHTYEQHPLRDWGCAPQLKKYIFYIHPFTISASQRYIFSSKVDTSVLWALFRLCSFCGLICCTPKPWKPFLPSTKENPNFSCKCYCYLTISLTLANYVTVRHYHILVLVHTHLGTTEAETTELLKVLQG